MTEPTDAEIIALADETRTAEGGANGYILPISFARAVLAKWGAPQPVACEPVACGNCGGTGWMVRDPDIGTDQECFVCDGSGRYSESATPQPTQAQAGAVPLTHDEALDAFCRTPGIYQFVQAFMAGVRFAEQYHGIGIKKGDSHG